MIQSQLERIEILKNELDKLFPLKPENQKILDKKFRLEFSYNSNHLEGNTLTYGETELLLMFDDTKGNHTLREFEEMKSHDIAFLKINEWAKEERDITESDIKELNKIILVRDFWKEAVTKDNQPTRRKISVGNYKQYPNSVRLENGEMFDYASVTDTPILMRELMNWYKTEGKDFHIVVLSALFHYKFVRIHPFDDGNGRIARLLLNYILLKNNYPPIIIKSTDKKNYLSALHKADLGDLEEFSKYILEQQIWSLELSIKAAKGENIDEPNDWEKKLSQMKMEVLKDKNRKIEVKFDQDTLDIILENSINPLINKLNETLKNFESLFNNSYYYILEEGRIKTGNDLETVFKKYVNQFGDRMNKMVLKYDFKGIRENQNIEVKNHFLNIDLNENNYIINVNNFNFVKFYDENLTDNEIYEIVNIIGTDLIQKIEEAKNA